MPETTGLVQHLGWGESTANIMIAESQTSFVSILLELRPSDPAPVREYKKVW